MGKGAPMLAVALFALMSSINIANGQTLAHDCRELGLYLAGCEKHVLSLSSCEQAHASVCGALFPTTR